jgi:hypothetical protein
MIGQVLASSLHSFVYFVCFVVAFHTKLLSDLMPIGSLLVNGSP